MADITNINELVLWGLLTNLKLGHHPAWTSIHYKNGSFNGKNEGNMYRLTLWSSRLKTTPCTKFFMLTGYVPIWYLIDPSSTSGSSQPCMPLSRQSQKMTLWELCPGLPIIRPSTWSRHILRSFSSTASNWSHCFLSRWVASQTLHAEVACSTCHHPHKAGRKLGLDFSDRFLAIFACRRRRCQSSRHGRYRRLRTWGCCFGRGCLWTHWFHGYTHSYREKSGIDYNMFHSPEKFSRLQMIPLASTWEWVIFFRFRGPQCVECLFPVLTINF